MNERDRQKSDALLDKIPFIIKPFGLVQIEFGREN